ncbi:MAG: PTS glucose transporter subunit IIA, partial [Eubacterium sp.]|nr:PTS glucose transporter subunit IIA [Eubacterium sp.]
EPAIFGINLRFMKPFICAMIGGAVGAIFGAVTKIGATAYGVTGIPGFLTINNLAVYAVMLLISGGIAFILTLIIWKEEAEELTPEQAAALAGEGEEQADAPAIETKDNTIYAPLKGNVIPYDKIPDPTFASGVLGKGVGIEPEVGEVVAPFDGTVSSVTDTKHAIGISGPQGMELLIHVGVDTVNMEGDGFEMFVGEGDTVKAGQKLISFDIEKIKAAGYSPTTAVLLTNSDDYEGFKITKEGTTGELEPVVEI